MGEANGHLPVKADDIILTSFEVRDLRFPTSLKKIGSDTMNKSGEQCKPYLEFKTSTDLRGVGWSHGNGQGSEVICCAIKAVAKRFVGRSLGSIVANMGETYRLIQSGQYRFISPERGVFQLAICCVLNAIWDLWAKSEGKPVWRLVADMTPDEYVRCIDFRYLTDVLTPEEALEMLKKAEPGKQERIKEALADRGVQAYNTSVGWLGFSDEEVSERIKAALAQGFTHFKLKVGQDLEADKRRLSLFRKIGGKDVVLMVDVNQIWDVPAAIEYMPKLKEYNILFVEEPTSPDDILGHATIKKALKPHGIGVATGEHVNNRVMFKQFLQAEALDAVQLDAMRMGGLQEIMSVMLLALKFGIPVVPHAGGVGQVELCSHISTIDFICVSGKRAMLEYTDHGHEYFVNGATLVPNTPFHKTPTAPGYSTDMKDGIFEEFECPTGTFWSSELGQELLNDPWRGVPGYQTSR